MASNTTLDQQPLYLNEEQILRYLTWPKTYEAVEQSLISVSEHNLGMLPNSSQPGRTFTLIPDKSGVLLSMPGYIGNYKLPSVDLTKKYNTLGCKLVTSFEKNLTLEPPLPKILANIFLFDNLTGKLNCILEATGITEWRTAAASLVATQHLYFNRLPKSSTHNNEDKILSIIGCGVQGRIHAIGMISYFKFSEIRLYNRTAIKAERLKTEIELKFRETSQNKNLRVVIFDSILNCCLNADVIVTATFASDPIIYSSMLKNNCHINAIGAGVSHYSELSPELYKKTKVYIDYWAGADQELQGLDTDIVGQVGDVICNLKPTPADGITVFQSMGMAVEDCAVGQMIYENYRNDRN